MSPAAPRFLTAIITFVVCACAQAQVGLPRNDLAIGVNGGYVINRVSFTPTIKQQWKGGETMGLSIRYTCEKYFSAICAIQAELNYANLGWRELIEYNEDTYSRDIRYFQLPIFARMGWGRERRGAQFFFQVGPQLNYFLSDVEHYSDPWEGRPRPNNVTQQYGKDVENKFEYGLVGGIGLEVSTGIGHFLLDARYYYGLSDIFHNGKKDPFGRSANGAIALKLSYLFDIIRTKGDIR